MEGTVHAKMDDSLYYYIWSALDKMYLFFKWLHHSTILHNNRF